MVHTKQAALGFNVFNVGVGLGSLLGFLLKSRRLSHDQPTQNQGDNDERHERREFRTGVRKPRLPFVGTEVGQGRWSFRLGDDLHVFRQGVALTHAVANLNQHGVEPGGLPGLEGANL